MFWLTWREFYHIRYLLYILQDPGFNFSAGGPFTYYVMVFFPIFDSPLPPCYTLLCFLKPPFYHNVTFGQPPHNALKSTVNRKGQKRRIWLLPTQTLSYGEPKFIVILLPCHTTMLKSHIMKYFTFEINLLGEKWKFCNFSFRPPRNALKVLK